MDRNHLIMIIEDDEQLRLQLMQVLMDRGFRVYAVTDFTAVLEEVGRITPSLIILDINLPYFDGNYYCHAIRKKYNMPIIITSARNSDSDQILSMELGSDDYVIKPFNINVLLSRIEACLRRTYGEYHNESVAVNGFVLNDSSMQLEYHPACGIYSEKDLSFSTELSKTEYKLMKAFLASPDRVIKREELLEAIWDDREFVDDNTLTVNITRIKKKLEDMGVSEAIKTKRGVGYIFSSAVGK